VDELQKELEQERLKSDALLAKERASSQHAISLNDARKAALADAETASVALRTCQIELDRARNAQQEADETRDFLVKESAQLKTALAELTADAESTAAASAKLKRDSEQNKLIRVVGRFMIRKSRQQLYAALEEKRRIQESMNELRRLKVIESQRADALGDELAQERRRSSIRDEHYKQQEEDAAKLTAENRLLLERVEQTLQTWSTRTRSRLCRRRGRS